MEVTQKAGTVFKNGVPVYIPNEIQQSDPSFYISYNASSRDYGCATTALVLKSPQMTKFFILCGDHRKQYDNAATLEACLTYYDDHKNLQHEYSDKR